MLLASCGAPSVEPSFDPISYQSFLASEPLLPFRARGALRFRYAGKTESGEFLLTALRGRAFVFQLLAPVTGSLAVEMRFDPQRLLAINHGEETYFLGPNTRSNRLRLFSLDMTAGEFLVLLTGRLPAEVYAAGAGRYFGAGKHVMESAGARHTFYLDDGGLPWGWLKERDGEEVFRVEYRDYFDVPDGDRPPLRVPRKVRVRSGGSGTLLVLGVREFLPGAESPQPLTFTPPEGEAWREMTLPEPAQ